MNKLTLLASIAVAALAGKAFYLVGNNEEVYSNKIPVSYINEHGGIIYGHTCGKWKDKKSRKTKTIIWQENPCYLILIDKYDSPKEKAERLDYRKIDSNTIEIYNKTNWKGDDDIAYNCDYTAKHKKIGKELDMDCEDAIEKIYALGAPGCERHYSGKMKRITYQVVDGHWQKVCETEFEFK